jgi:NADH-quinone oxidoreductase subunit F
MAEEHKVLLAGTDEHDLTKLDDYRAIGGYRGVEKARAMTSDELIEELQKANLRGRGGAGFPMGRKASLIDRKSPKPKYLVVNADESEPGAFKDRQVMATVPHRLIEGCLIAAHAIQSRSVFIYIRGEYSTEYDVLQAAVDEAQAAGLMGDVSIVVHRGAGAYICGEETALLESLEGKRGQPRSKPPFPAIEGVYASPTLINNVETITTIPVVLQVGPAEFAKIGVPPDSTGTRVFCLSGNVVRPGAYERPHGITVRELIYDVGGGIADGRELKAVMVGGSSFPVMTPDEIDTKLDATSLGQRGLFIGSGVITAIDDRACIVQFALRVAQFYMHESCGKCTPCRVGTRWLVQLLRAVESGSASERDLELLLDVCDRIIGKCLCVLGDSAAMPVASCVTKFRDEFHAHLEHGGCPFGADSSLDRLFAPVDQHHLAPVAHEAGV